MFYRSLNIAFVLLIIYVSGCDTIIDTKEKPGNADRSAEFKIHLIDQTGHLEKIYGHPNVTNANVLLKSNTLGEEYNLVSDENGLVSINNIISDLYLVSTTRSMTRDEMEHITGHRLDFYRLVNSTIGTLELNAGNNQIIELPLDKLTFDSPILISEIYACGPPDAGLYFHDKYIEVFNQSDSIAYLDGIIIATVYVNSYLGISYEEDPEYVHVRRVWMFPGSGEDYPINPGEFKVCAADAIDHRVNAPNSVDLSEVSFEFYKDDAPDIDNPDITNMIKIHQRFSEVDWLISGEHGAIVIAQMNPDSLGWYDEHRLIPIEFVLDGVEYLDDVSRLDEKILTTQVDGGGTGGIQFYTGKSMERKLIRENGKYKLKDNNNSSLDFQINNRPTPEYHKEIGP